jgi:hypothetical protein
MEDNRVEVFDLLHIITFDHDAMMSRFSQFSAAESGETEGRDPETLRRLDPIQHVLRIAASADSNHEIPWL